MPERALIEVMGATLAWFFHRATPCGGQDAKSIAPPCRGAEARAFRTGEKVSAFREPEGVAFCG
ncbi:hypothetical protein Aph01nite_29250 [Acrocarpospora phusangensis]|uniref:Uncharacterized protein n=1 Tax=Acrocarpospora phusangensis TaxID=1070424 RepID=A0A919QC24_9ACTN|nr:hypothetical protein Aph01nite_29250 [Acrocarpospora phusangensis]